MKIKNDKKNKNIVFIILIILAFFKPGILENYKNLNTAFNIYTIIISALIIIYYLSKKRISKLQFIIILQIFMYTFATLLNSRDFYTLIAFYIPFLGISMFSELMIIKDMPKFIKSVTFVIFVEIAINLYTVIKYPTGMYGEGEWGSFKYFLGYDNTSALTVVLGIIFIVMNSYLHKGKLDLKANIGIIIGIVTYLITKAITPLIAILIEGILIFYIFRNKKERKDRIINYKLFCYIALCLFFLIVVCRIQDLFAYFIEEILNKSLTFTGRTFIWDRSINYFLDSPIIGNGVFNFESRQKLINIYHAHSTFLNILMESGVIGFLIHMYTYYLVGRSLDKIKNTKIYKIISIGFLSMFILTLMEVYRYNYAFYILLNLAFNADIIVKKYINNKRKENE